MAEGSQDCPVVLSESAAIEGLARKHDATCVIQHMAFCLDY